MPNISAISLVVRDTFANLHAYKTQLAFMPKRIAPRVNFSQLKRRYIIFASFKIESGIVWVPETRYAEQVVDEITEFPYGDNDDLVDSTTQALLRFRQGGFIRHPADYEDEDWDSPTRQFVYY